MTGNYLYLLPDVESLGEKTKRTRKGLHDQATNVGLT